MTLPFENFEIIAGAVLIAAALLGVAVYWSWQRFRPVPAQQANTPPPCRITLIAEENPSWKGEKAIVRYTDHFRAIGFQRLGAFRIPELDSQRILALIHPTEKFYACVYDSKTHPTFEIFAEFDSDNSLMGTNSTWVRDVEQRPGSVTLQLANATPAQALEALRQHEKAPDRVSVKSDGFVGAFLKAYARNLNWKLKKGDITRDQIRLEARRDGHALTSEQIEEQYRAKRAAYVAQLQDGCRAQYRDEQKIEASEWQRLQNRLFAVPETFELKEVINSISYAVPSALNEKQLQALQRLETSLGDNGIVFIEKIVTKNIGELGLKQLGQVKEPVRAWIMVVTEGEAPAAASEDDGIPDQSEEKAAA